MRAPSSGSLLVGHGAASDLEAVPAEERQAIYDEAALMLDDSRDVDGTIELGQEVRYTLARRG